MATGQNPMAALKLGPYELLAELGAGGMGRVYLALQRGAGGFEKRVAIKCIVPEVANDVSFIRMLVDEARIMVRLTHPNIVQALDLRCDDGQYSLVMEYIEGCDLDTLVQTSGKLTLSEAIFVGIETARGLAYAHRSTDENGKPLGVVHRDISGHNLLVTVHGQIKIADFGIAKAATNRQRTQAGSLKGKLAYMSPEQALGKVVDARSDIFSLGIVLWELVVGERLFCGDTDIQTLLKVQRCDIRPPRALGAACPSDLEIIILRCLARDAQARYPDAAQLANDLDRALKSLPHTEPPAATLAHRVERHLAQHRLRPLALQEGRTIVAADDGCTVQVAVGNRLQARHHTRSARPSTRRLSRTIGVGLALGVLMASTLLWLWQTQQARKSPAAKTWVAALDRPQPVSILAPGQQTAPKLHGLAPTQESTTSTRLVVALPTPAQPPSMKRTTQQVEIQKPTKISRSKVVSSPRVTPLEPTVERTVTPSSTEPRVAATETALLSINTDPWARVYINGKAVATTPLIAHRLPAGAHRVVLVNPELRLRRELTINLSPGEHLRTRVTLPAERHP